MPDSETNVNVIAELKLISVSLCTKEQLLPGWPREFHINTVAAPSAPVHETDERGET